MMPLYDAPWSNEDISVRGSVELESNEAYDLTKVFEELEELSK